MLQQIRWLVHFIIFSFSTQSATNGQCNARRPANKILRTYRPNWTQP